MCDLICLQAAVGLGLPSRSARNYSQLLLCVCHESRPAAAEIMPLLKRRMKRWSCIPCAWKKRTYASPASLNTSQLTYMVFHQRAYEDLMVQGFGSRMSSISDGRTVYLVGNSILSYRKESRDVWCGLFGQVFRLLNESDVAAVTLEFMLFYRKVVCIPLHIP